MMIVVAFCCSIGGWFVGCVSAYLLYRVTEQAVPKPRTGKFYKRMNKHPPEQWRRYDSQTYSKGDKLPGLNVQITDDGCELLPEPTKLELVR